MFKKLMTKLGRYRVILDREEHEPYLERYYVFLKDRQWFPFNIFIHRFLKSDPDVCHDHPWPFCSIILSGGYWEWRPTYDAYGYMNGETAQWKGAGQIRFSNATDYHRVELEPEVTPVTLFIPGPKVREWGFLKNNRWIQHETYFKSKKENKNA